MIEHDMTARGCARVKALHELTADFVPRTPDLASHPAFCGRKLVSEACPNQLSPLVDNIIDVKQRHPSRQTAFGSSFPLVRVTAIPTVTVISAALDDGSCKVLGGHQVISSSSSRASAARSAEKRSSGVRFRDSESQSSRRKNPVARRSDISSSREL